MSVDPDRSVCNVDAASGGDMRRKSHDDLTSAPPSGNTGLPAADAVAPAVAGPIAESSEKGPAAEPATASVLSESNTDTPESSDDDDQAPPPDGGTRAWLMILGTWCCSFCSYGWINSVGIFQQYYATGPLRDYSASQIAWIPSLQIFFMAFLGPLIGHLNDRYGPRWLVVGGTFLHVFGLMMASLATRYHEILLAQGVCSAIGVACVFLPALMGLAGWFTNQRRGLAFGLISTGSSLGGVVFPLLIAHLLRTVGYAWTMRICAFLILALLAIANAFVRARTLPAPRKGKGEGEDDEEKAKKQGGRFARMLRPLRERPFQLLLLGQFLIPFGMYVPITYLPTAAVAGGMGEGLSQNLVTFYNAASLVGRASSGYASDKLGKFNVFCGACLASGALVLAMWIPGRGDGVVVAFAVLFGLVSGAYISLMAALVAQISPPAEVGYRNGLCFLASSVGGLTTSPLAGAIMAGPAGWPGLKAFAGVMMIAGTLITALVRGLEGGWGLAVVF